MTAPKFEDCRSCIYFSKKRRNPICRECDYGEFFEGRTSCREKNNDELMKLYRELSDHDE
jgi:hypothetical protein